jgi:hypothetical protein
LSHGERGLQVFHRNDVSTMTGCIQRVLRDKSRSAF